MLGVARGIGSFPTLSACLIKQNFDFSISMSNEKIKTIFNGFLILTVENLKFFEFFEVFYRFVQFFFNRFPEKTEKIQRLF